MASRGISHHESDKKRLVYGRDELYLRRYIGTHVIGVLAADAELARAHTPILSPGMRKALEVLVPLSIEE